MAQFDESINMPDTIMILHKANDMVDGTNPTTSVDISKVAPETSNKYGETIELLMAKLCDYSSRVNIVFDTYLFPSVKYI